MHVVPSERVTSAPASKVSSWAPLATCGVDEIDGEQQ